MGFLKNMYEIKYVKKYVYLIKLLGLYSVYWVIILIFWKFKMKVGRFMVFIYF